MNIRSINYKVGVIKCVMRNKKYERVKYELRIRSYKLCSEK